MSGERLRLWDEDFTHCLYDSETSDQTVEEFMHDQTELTFTIDRPPANHWRTRRGGKVMNEAGVLRWLSHRSLLERLEWPEPDIY